MEDNNTPEAPSPCTAGCGFYGNKIYNNMCSKCFKEHEAQNKLDIAKQTVSTTSKPSTATATASPPSLTTASDSITTLPQKKNNEAPATVTQLNKPAQDTVIDKSNKEAQNQNDNEEAAAAASAASATTAEKSNENEDDKKPVQKNKGRCFSCRSKIPLAKQLTNKCRCDYIFCDTHRFPDKHNCTFDHAKNDKDILAKLNPKINDKPRGGNSFQRIDSY